MKVHELITPSTVDKGATEMSYPNVYDKKNRDFGARKKLRKEKVTLRDTATGRVYGRRTIVQNAT